MKEAVLRWVALYAALALSLAPRPSRSQITAVAMGSMERVVRDLPIDGKMSLVAYLKDYPRDGGKAIQTTAWLDEERASNLASGRNVTLQIFLRENLAPTIEDFTVKGTLKISLFNSTYGYLAERVQYGRPNDATRWYVGVLAAYVADPSGNDTVPDVPETVPVTLRVGWGGDLCVSDPVTTADWSSKVRRCQMSARFPLHETPGWSFREDGVARSLQAYTGKTDSTCTELTLNNSCAFWFPKCDEDGFKLPICTDMCNKWVTECVQDPRAACVQASSQKCTGFPIPEPGLGSSAILLIVLVSLIIVGIVLGSLIGMYRKRQYREQMERESAAREEARVPDQFGITSGPSSAPPVLHQATISLPSQPPAREKQVRTFDVTNFDDPASGSGSEGDGGSSDVE